MKLFGTDGLRGTAGLFPLDPDSVRLVGREVGRRVEKSGRKTVVLGGDTRESTPPLLGQLTAGISDARCAVACAGVISTPGVAEVVLALQAGAGISVSASHNPYEDNGIKIFGPDGRKWPDSEEEALEEILFASAEPRAQTRKSADAPMPPPAADPALPQMYLARLASHVPARLAGMPVVLDAGNGAAFRLGPEALRRADARLTVIAVEPDGQNINAGCGALHPAAMAKTTRDAGAALGVALDGDADRSIFADENGRVLDGDDILWIIARDWKRRGRLPEGGVVGTVMSNFGLEAALEREGIPFHRAAVGDRNVARLMEESGAAIGGETSGHIILPFSPAGDGILTSLLLASIVSESGGPISRIATLEKTPQALRNVRVQRRVPFEEIPGIAEALARAKETLDHRGRVFLRYSGTEPLLRILVESPEEKEVLSIADDLEAAVKRELT